MVVRWMNIAEAASQVLAATGPLANPQTDLPRLARDLKFTDSVDRVLGDVATTHHARDLSAIPSGSVHLIVTSPPYWTLKRYNDTDGQLGHMENYEAFVSELDKVWAECLRLLMPGGRLVCVVGTYASHVG